MGGGGGQRGATPVVEAPAQVLGHADYSAQGAVRWSYICHAEPHVYRSAERSEDGKQRYAEHRPAEFAAGGYVDGRWQRFGVRLIGLGTDRTVRRRSLVAVELIFKVDPEFSGEAPGEVYGDRDGETDCSPNGSAQCAAGCRHGLDAAAGRGGEAVPLLGRKRKNGSGRGGNEVSK